MDQIVESGPDDRRGVCKNGVVKKRCVVGVTVTVFTSEKNCSLLPKSREELYEVPKGNENPFSILSKEVGGTHGGRESQL